MDWHVGNGHAPQDLSEVYVDRFLDIASNTGAQVAATSWQPAGHSAVTAADLMISANLAVSCFIKSPNPCEDVGTNSAPVAVSRFGGRIFPHHVTVLW